MADERGELNRVMADRDRALAEFDADADDRALARRAFVKVLDNPKAGARATAQAATGLARLAGAPAQVDEDEAPDPMRDLQALEDARERAVLSARDLGALSARIEAGEDPDVIVADVERLEHERG